MAKPRCTQGDVLADRDDKWAFAKLMGAVPPQEVPGDSCDSEAELLAEEFGSRGVTVKLAQDILDWQSRTGDHATAHAMAGAVVRSILFRIVNAKEPLREAEYLRVAFGFRESNNESQRSIAKRIGVTVESVSKRAAVFRKLVGLACNSFTKSEELKAIYARTNGRRPRRKPEQAAAA